MNFNELIIPGNLIMRKMTNDDLDTVMRIEGASFDSPWTRSNFADELKNTDIALPLVLEQNKLIIGFIVLWIILDECHLANIAVTPDYRGRGLGKLMMQNIISIARQNKCVKVMLEVRKSNTTAIALYQKFLFEKVGMRKNYYHDGFMNTEDALLMDLNLI